MKGLDEKNLITVILALEDAIDMCELNITFYGTTRTKRFQKSIEKYQDLHDKLII